MQTKGLTDVAGIAVGHVSDFDGLTGCTAVLCTSGAVGGVDVRGSATGSEELDLLNPLHTTDRIHAVMLAGGSAFGLEAASGVRRYLEREGVGYQTGAARVPLVPAAIIYDLSIGKASARPTREMGEAAAAHASSGPVQEGPVGAGTGATVGKLLGMDHAMKSGLGTATVSLSGGVVVSALAVVNAVGDVIDPETGRILAGTRVSAASREFANSTRLLESGNARQPLRRQNTTLVVVATDALLSKPACTKLAQLASAGVARTISPVWTTYDGDIVFALSVGRAQADINALGVAAAKATSQAILRAVRLAPSMGGVPGLAV
ncbi:MAG TPA: P1 family peptidase [Bryobacteraceae bacterium]|nr:P1 family peptidase [Bryobacteraceae bacterium]